MNYSLVKKVSTSANIDDVFHIVNRDGAVIISDILNEGGVKQLVDEINPLFECSHFCDGLFYGKKTKRIHSLVAKSEAYRKLVVHPFLLKLTNRILTLFCDKIQLNVTQGSQIWPGAEAQIQHRDDTKFPVKNFDCEFMTNTILACNTFTRENGCTKIALGSHKWEDRQRRPTEEEMSYAEMEAGDALMIVGSVIHAAGANCSAAPRTAVVMGYCLGWIRQTENQYLVAPPEMAKNFPAELQDLLGYTIHRPNLGMYEGDDPKILFHPPAEREYITRDWLTPELNKRVQSYYAARTR